MVVDSLICLNRVCRFNVEDGCTKTAVALDNSGKCLNFMGELIMAERDG